MPYNGELFSIFSNTCSVEYRNVRDAQSAQPEHVREWLERAQEHCEDLWKEFRPYADRHFISEFSRHFHQRWFEMYLAVSLMRRGFEINSKNKGPDILMEVDGRKMWIEAVCVTAGELGRPDSVPRIPNGKLARVPMDQYALRILSSLQEKAAKLRAYIDKGIVLECEILAVAINVHKIDGTVPYLHLDDIVMRSLFGLGGGLMKFDKYTGELKETDREIVSEIVKSSGSPVEVQPFVDGSMKHVSAALMFHCDAANIPKKLGDDCMVYPNLSCLNSWPTGIIPMGREWTFGEFENSWKLNQIDHLHGC